MHGKRSRRPNRYAHRKSVAEEIVKKITSIMSDVLILVYYSFSLLRDGMTVYQTALGLQLLIKGYIHYRAYLFPHIIWLKKKINIL